MSSNATHSADVVVIGGGQAGLAAGYYLRRTGLDFVILDDNPYPGGSWQHYWQSLTLFSPAEYSSLPGWPMPPYPNGFPPATHVVDYLTRYEHRYELPIRRPVSVTEVTRTDHGFHVHSDDGGWDARRVINATGSWRQPFWPLYPGISEFAGRQLHTVDYRSPEPFAGQRVAVVGGGNSAAQIVADLSAVAEPLWCTPRPPRYLPDDVDGRVLFTVASEHAAAVAAGRPSDGGVGGLGDIVAVPSVRAARDRGQLTAHPMFTHLTAGGVVIDGVEEQVDAIIWCTGFRPALRHLHGLVRTRGDHHPVVDNHLVDDPAMMFLGYGDWTGPASATLIGVGRTARSLLAPARRRPR
ncbi:ArsO family NAD(P)H-dependent flavin-containing monooxygenase [Williamsia phyllosphaerae]|uniref:Monooxygenase n=1 Tax=Williamsia phyllosphaerae TaxID=885042 RepID=A0ABQ1V6R5_9NOCA|nr:ArsO family NAD(P)H-dependent flavin-containing monooxygenase [Williamsia phyllosphaerae]GGF40902.1 monooxygenase [Williamsia phyllosphaerae]